MNQRKRQELPDKLREKIENAWKEDVDELSLILPSLPNVWKRNSELTFPSQAKPHFLDALPGLLVLKVCIMRVIGLV